MAGRRAELRIRLRQATLDPVFMSSRRISLFLLGPFLALGFLGGASCAAVASLPVASVHAGQEAPAALPGDALTVVSLNLALREDAGVILDGLRAVGGDRADVMLLQEVVERPGEPSVATQIAEALGLNAVYRAGFSLNDGRSVGLATLTRLPVLEARVLPLKRFDLTFRSRDRIALTVTLAGASRPIDVYNLHLDTRLNIGDRLAQLANVLEDLDADRAIVGGDFNTNDHFWLFHTVPLPFVGRQESGLERQMARHGLISAFDEGATHDTLRMRLDWLFLKGLEATTRSIHPMAISDHHALVTVVR